MPLTRIAAAGRYTFLRSIRFLIRVAIPRARESIAMATIATLTNMNTMAVRSPAASRCEWPFESPAWICRKSTKRIPARLMIDSEKAMRGLPKGRFSVADGIVAIMTALRSRTLDAAALRLRADKGPLARRHRLRRRHHLLRPAQALLRGDDLDPRRQRPLVAERVRDLAHPIAPEHERQRHLHLGARRDRALPRRVDVRHV